MMAAVCATLDSKRVLDLKLISSDPSIGLYLCYDGKRVKWLNDLYSLKDFVKNVVKSSGKWSSPGGQSRKFTSSTFDISMTWYYGKQKTLLFQGKDGNELRETIIKACMAKSSTNNQNQSIGMGDNVVCTNNFTTPINSDKLATETVFTHMNDQFEEHETSKGNLAKNLDQDCTCSCTSNSTDYDDLKLNFEILQSRVDALQALANTQKVGFSEIGCSNEIECLKTELCLEREKTQRMESDLRLVNKKLCELHSHYMICNTSNSNSGICICNEPPKPKAVRDVNHLDSLNLIAQPGSPNCAINGSVNSANINGINPIKCNLNSDLNCKATVSQAHSQYNQRSPSHNSGFVEKSLTVQPVCRNRFTNRIKGNKGQDVVVKPMEHNVNKNKSNKPMESQDNHEFDHNVPTYCEPLSIKLLGSLPLIEAAKPFKIQKKKTPAAAGNNNGIDNKGENKEAMLKTYNLHNKAPHNKLRGNKNLPFSCAFLSSNSLGNLPFIETLKPSPIRKKEKIKTNNCIKIPVDISEFIVLDSDEHSSENANIESRFFWRSVLERPPSLPFVPKAEWLKHLDLVRRQTTI